MTVSEHDFIISSLPIIEHFTKFFGIRDLQENRLTFSKFETSLFWQQFELESEQILFYKSLKICRPYNGN